MDFEYFLNKSQREAAEYLSWFQACGHKAATEFAEDAVQAGVQADWTLTSLPQVVAWAASFAKVTRMERDESLPGYLQLTQAMSPSAFSFDEGTVRLIFTMGYYFGETLVRAHSCLSWASGNRDTLLHNQPVVTGFRHDKQLSVLMVMDTLFARLKRGLGEACVVSVLNAWQQDIPE